MLNLAILIIRYPISKKWINRNDNVFTNTPAALQAMGIKGYYEAVKRMTAYEMEILERFIDEDGIDEDAVSDWLSDETGWLHDGLTVVDDD